MKKQTTYNLQLTTSPQHVAVIMDGNRRWARERGLPPLAGHQQVVDRILEPLIEHAAKRGVKYLTFWAWSTENWERDRREVAGIMKIFKHVIARKWEKLHKKGVRIKVIGDISKFDKSIRLPIEQVVAQTKNNVTITVTLALNYGGRDEIVRAIDKWRASRHPEESGFAGRREDPQRVSKALGDSISVRQRIQNDNLPLTKEEFSKYLDTFGTPDPELIVRTGGEQRLSGFLSWQSEYSELFFVKWYMPEFTPEKLDEILADFSARQRRFGR